MAAQQLSTSLLAQKKVKLNLLHSWWLRQKQNSQLEPFYETVCFGGQGSPGFHVISRILLGPKPTPGTNSPPQQKCVAMVRAEAVSMN